jgi:hypothetical protein
MHRYLLTSALVTSMLILSGCGNGGDTPSDIPQANTAVLQQTESNLASVQAQSQDLQVQLNAANQKVAEKKHILDDVQTKLAVGGVTEETVAAAQAAYEKASDEVRQLEQKKATLAAEARRLAERADTLKAAIELDRFIYNLGAKVLDGTISTGDVHKFVGAVVTKKDEELVVPANKFIRDVKQGLNTPDKIRVIFPRMLNSPIIDEFLLPLLAAEIQHKTETVIVGTTYLKTLPGSKASVNGLYNILLPQPQVKHNQDERYTLTVPFKGLIQSSISGLRFELDLDEGEHTEVLTFIDAYFRDNSAKVKEEIELALENGKPTVLRESLQATFRDLKPVVSDVLSKMPNNWLGWIAQMIQSIEEDVDAENIKELKEMLRNDPDIKALIPLSTSAPLSSASNMSHRAARLGKTEITASHLLINEQYVNQSYGLSIPLTIQLKGSVNTNNHNANIVGSAAYKLNDTVISFIQSYVNQYVLRSQLESSLLLSQSYKDFFIEGQAGFITSNKDAGNWCGHRYQLTLGYDAAIASPFAQISYTSLENDRKGTLGATGIYVGLDTDIISLQQSQTTVTSQILMKVGYEVAIETLGSGMLLRPNQGWSAFVEWNGNLKLSDGLNVATSLTLGSSDPLVRISVNFEQ